MKTLVGIWGDRVKGFKIKRVQTNEEPHTNTTALPLEELSLSPDEAKTIVEGLTFLLTYNK